MVKCSISFSLDLGLIEKLRKEKNKSALIEMLLHKHFGKMDEIKEVRKIIDEQTEKDFKEAGL